MNITYKEQLSKHVENIFMGYSKHGLHICDIATGGGKSYTIGKLKSLIALLSSAFKINW